MIIWTEADHATASCQAAQTTGCLGLVRGRTDKTLGLRYKTMDYDKAWQTIKPNEAVPTQLPGQHVYKLEGLPFGCSQVAIKQWLDVIKWQATPFRALGGTTWIVKTNEEPPEGVQTYNTMPVLIRFLPPRAKIADRILTGSQPKPLTDPWTRGDDPWTNYRPTAPSSSVAPPNRQVQGPVESRFAAQDEKISAMKHEIEQLAQTQQATMQQVKQIDANQKQQGQDFATAMTQLKSDVDVALQNTMQHHSKQMDSRFDELMKLMKSKAKRSRGKEDGDMSE